MIQQQNSALANVFLRRVREAVFAFNQNVADHSVLVEIVNNLELDGEVIVKEAEQLVGQQLLNKDFKLAASLGVRGFPTIILVNKENKGVKIVGARPLENYVVGLKQVLNSEEILPKQQPSLSSLIKQEELLFSKEIEVMYDVEQSNIKAFIEKELSTSAYQEKEILGESYFTAKNNRGE